jgi:sulfate adenylyltransferase
LAINQRVALKDPEGNLLALLTVESIWEPDRKFEAQTVFGTLDELHPAVYYLNRCGEFYVGGKISGVQLPTHYDFTQLRRTNFIF